MFDEDGSKIVPENYRLEVYLDKIDETYQYHYGVVFPLFRFVVVTFPQAFSRQNWYVGFPECKRSTVKLELHVSRGKGYCHFQSKL